MAVPNLFRDWFRELWSRGNPIFASTVLGYDQGTDAMSEFEKNYNLFLSLMAPALSSTQLDALQRKRNQLYGRYLAQSALGARDPFDETRSLQSAGFLSMLDLGELFRGLSPYEAGRSSVAQRYRWYRGL